MKKILASILFVTAALFATVSGVSAAVSCQPIYGGGQTCVEVGRITVNKTVQNPQTNAFVDNLGINDPKFKGDQTVNFQIVVTNVSDQAISRVNVSDVFPNFVNFVSGPGSFDQNSKTLTFSFDNLGRGESRTFNFAGVVAPANQLPADRGVMCVANQVTVRSEPSNEGAQDNAQFCIEKQVIGVEVVPGKGGPQVVQQPPVTITPKSGPEMLSLLALFPMGAAGMYLRRKTSI